MEVGRDSRVQVIVRALWELPRFPLHISVTIRSPSLYLLVLVEKVVVWFPGSRYIFFLLLIFARHFGHRVASWWSFTSLLLHD